MIPRHAVVLLCTAIGQIGFQSQAAEWRAVADLRVGSDSVPDEILTTVGGLAVGSDGTLYVVQPREGLVKMFTARGRFIRSIGRRGAGPGEFQVPQGIGWKRDTLWVADIAQRRVSFFSVDGRFVRMERVPLPAAALGVSSDGAIVAAGSAPAQAVALGQVSRVPLLRVRGDSPLGDTIAMLDVRNQVWRIANDRNPSGRVSYLDQPFSASTLWRIAVDGLSVWIVDRSPASDSRPTTFELSRISLGVNQRTVWRIPYSPVAITPAAVDVIVLSEAERGFQRRVFETISTADAEVRKGLFVPAFAPPVADFLAGRDGTLWLRRASHDGDSWWIVVGSSGQIEATVRLPSNVRVFEADRYAVWGSVRDSLDVEAVVRFALRKP